LLAYRSPHAELSEPEVVPEEPANACEPGDRKTNEIWYRPGRLPHKLVAGDHVEASLLFEKAGTVNIEFDVLATGAKSGRERPGMNMPGHWESIGPAASAALRRDRTWHKLRRWSGRSLCGAWNSWGKNLGKLLGGLRIAECIRVVSAKNRAPAGRRGWSVASSMQNRRNSEYAASAFRAVTNFF
jgi:hypothetical protein